MGLWASIKEYWAMSEREAKRKREGAPPSPTRVTARAYISQKPDGYETPYLSDVLREKLLVPDAEGMPPLRLKRHDGGWWLMEITTGKLVNVKVPSLSRLGIWAVRVRGDQHYDANLRVGPVQLVREPDNPYDPNAVAIHQFGRMIGHYNKQKARSLAKLLDSGETLDAYAISTDPPKVIAAAPRVMKQLWRRDHDQRPSP